MESINQKISDETLDLGPGYCIGHSFSALPIMIFRMELIGIKK